MKIVSKKIYIIFNSLISNQKQIKLIKKLKKKKKNQKNQKLLK